MNQTLLRCHCQGSKHDFRVGAPMNELYRLPEELVLLWPYPGALFAQHVFDIVRNKLGTFQSFFMIDSESQLRTGFSNQA